MRHNYGSCLRLKQEGNVNHKANANELRSALTSFVGDYTEAIHFWRSVQKCHQRGIFQTCLKSWQLKKIKYGCNVKRF